ncbi:hypothetical protein [Paenibacillus agri]|uniref:Uncharacterized protein n=1 Tax=Paenibacillus agri TaxID=2744309 RepID=A0A850EQZ7_9BACL|nr:hypothetical protein [Paenibacillus agri]NUU62169.1 hypothetical protein [Paenibacillus agri]
MSSNLRTSSQKPQAVMLTQILLYLAAVVNLFNGFYSIGSNNSLKMTLAAIMILFGLVAIWVASRLGQPIPSRRNHAIVLASILILLRIVEYFVWHNFGFLVGIILPVLVVWRLGKTEAKEWYSAN